jgi:hypothetical protein
MEESTNKQKKIKSGNILNIIFIIRVPQYLKRVSK